MTDMPSKEQLCAVVLRSEIETLVAECAYCLDRGDFGSLVDNFTEDCEVLTPKPPFDRPAWTAIRGKPDLVKYYAGPPWTTSVRTMRHVVSNFRLRPESDNRVNGTVTLIGYRHEGDGVSAALPLMVGDYEDVYARGDDGRWRIARRKVVIQFLSQELLNAQYPETWNIPPSAR